MTKQEKALQESKEKFEKWIKDIIELLEDDLRQLQEREFRDYYDFLTAKMSTINMLLLELPLGAGFCPFCKENMEGLPPNNLLLCHKCEYQKTHGVCTQDGSVYKIIMWLVKLLTWTFAYLYSQKELDKTNIYKIREEAYKVFRQFDLLLSHTERSVK